MHSQGATTPFEHSSLHSRGQNAGIGAEINPPSLLRSVKKLLDVTGIEPAPGGVFFIRLSALLVSNVFHDLGNLLFAQG